MNNDEKSRVHAAILTHMMLAQTAYVLDKRGVGDPDLMDLAFGLNALVINTPGLKSWWNQAKDAFSPEFVAIFERERAKHTSATDVFPWLVLDAVEPESNCTSSLPSMPWDGRSVFEQGLSTRREWETARGVAPSGGR